jgi:hypothetical protein
VRAAFPPAHFKLSIRHIDSNPNVAQTTASDILAHERDAPLLQTCEATS